MTERHTDAEDEREIAVTDPADAHADPRENGKGSEDEGTLLAQLRAARRDVSADRSLKLPIPSYKNGLLVAEYRVIEWDELNEIREKFETNRSPRKILFGHIEVLARACECFYVKDPASGDLVALHERLPEMGDVPVRYDSRLATVAGIQPRENTARSTMRALFGDDYMITLHHNEYMEWRSEITDEDDEDFSGA